MVVVKSNFYLILYVVEISASEDFLSLMFEGFVCFFPQWVPCSLSLSLYHDLCSQSCWKTFCALEQKDQKQTDMFLNSDPK